jgi:hypothetical protein
MILSRVWYVLLGIAVGVALYVVYVAVGQYERQTTHALKEGLASDSQTVEWALKIDARRRLDALLAGSVDKAIQDALVLSDGAKDGKVPPKAKTDAKNALGPISTAIPADWRPDALFAVDRDGHVVAQVGLDTILNGNEDFELGGYPAVNDALHGWLRDDVWFWGAKLYVVVARPVEFDVTQRPAGAIVGIKEVNGKFAGDLSKRTRTNVAFYAAGKNVATGAGADGFDPEKLNAVGADLGKVDDKTYGEGGRSDVRMLTDDLGAIYARLPGDVWSLGGGFAVARSKTPLGGPMGFLSSADDKDKANVPWALLVAVALGGAFIGLLLTYVEYNLPLNELRVQAERFKTGAVDGLQVARFRGVYRLAAQGINQGLEKAIEKSGGVTRKPADLESILGPTPAQPAMSAFSFPGPADVPAHGPSPVPPAPPAPPISAPQARITPTPAPGGANGSFPSSPGPAPRAPPPPSNPRAAPPPRPPPPLHAAPALDARPAPPPPALFPPPAPASAPVTDEDEDATMVGSVPAEVMAQATGLNEASEWRSVYDEFVRTKKQCGEPVDGLSFEKFSQTLKKNRDALVQRHACKRVKFSVYVKEGKASLKATPVKD